MDAKTTYERRDDVQLVDVREPDEWEAGHIQGAVHIPMRELNSRQNELAEDRPIVTVCRSGARASAVTDALKRAGYQTDTLDGGMQAWARNGLPFVSDSASEPHVA
jgi:rhodanese-related sulfurtransferase